MQQQSAPLGAAAAAGGTGTGGVPRLSLLAVQQLIRHRHCILDLGWLEPASVRMILSHCNAEELAQIEDGTLEGSGRDLAWYTWDLWAQQHERKFGAYQPGKTQLMPLPGAQPPDYVPPKGVAAPTAHWRAILQRDLKKEKDKAASVSDRLRNLYAAANKEKASRSVEVCVIEPPRKRARMGPGGGGASASASSSLGKASQIKQALGLSKPGGGGGGGGYGVTKKVTVSPALHYNARPGGGGGQGRPGSSTTTVSRSGNVTRTVTVHKAAAPPSAAAAAGALSRGGQGGAPASRLGGGAGASRPGGPQQQQRAAGGGGGGGGASAVRAALGLGSSAAAKGGARR